MERLRELRVDRAHGSPAPHKPLLLLSLIDSIGDGTIDEPFVPHSPELTEAFADYWDATDAADGPGLIALPFFHLRSEGFWTLVPEKGMAEVVQATQSIRSLSRLQLLTKGARINEGLWALLQDAAFRQHVRDTLLATYFSPAEVERLRDVERRRTAVARARQHLMVGAETDFHLRQTQPNDEERLTRSAAFRSAVLRIYDHTCAVCGFRLITPQGASAIVAAHIVPFSVSYNDDPRNGLGLCRQHHWCFDAGLLSAADDLTIVVSPALDPRRPTEDRLTELRAKPLLLPRERKHWPSSEAFQWHRLNVLQRDDT